MKKNIKILLLILGIVGMSFPMMVPTTQAAPIEYPLLEKIPGTANLSGNNLSGYLSAVYKVALIVVTLSAVFMLSVGGFMYLTSAGNTSSIGTAKGIIYDSLIGLVIALSAWLILYIINPDLIEITLEGLPPIATEAPQATPSGFGTLPSGSDQELARQILANGRITLASSGSCKTSGGFVTPKSNIQSVADGKRADKCTPGCGPTAVGCLTEAVGLSNTMLAAMLAAATVMPYTVTSIAGGAHAGSGPPSHYQGQGIDVVPVSQNLLDAFVKAGAIAPGGDKWPSCVAMGGIACGNTSGASMCEGGVDPVKGRNVGCFDARANHIHINFPR